ncbi:HNH endonuclease [Candidatus Palauibacter sp.]|uniref:HNH endonuclease n=1 Tax=Candidatus Palauibacter sp. TaxID=3101350 RepID=UPI003AF213B3
MEAAHIQWHSHEGPDEVANGLALCLLHHKALDRGALGLGETTGSLVDFSGQRIRRPRTRTLQPAPEYVDWHRKEVFRSRTA